MLADQLFAKIVFEQTMSEGINQVMLDIQISMLCSWSGMLPVSFS